MRILNSSRKRGAVIAVVVASVLATVLFSQSIESGKLAVLIDGIGTYGRPITTASIDAQKFFDQGLRLTFGYYFPEAIASFQEAQRYDPDHPMIRWGLAPGSHATATRA